MNAIVRTCIVLTIVGNSATALLLAQQPAGGNPPAANPPASTVTANPTPAPPVRSARDLQEDRAKILMAEKRYEAGIQTYLELLKLEPKNAVYMNMIGIAYLNMSNFDQARRFFQRSAKADKKYSSAVNNLGMVWYEQKNYRRAIREYQRAAVIDPSQAGTHANLGFAHYKLKNYADAASEFHKALEIDPHALDRNERVGTMVQDRTVENHGMFFYMMAREYARMGDAVHCADYLRKSYDEGYKDLIKARTDPDFKKVVNDPAVQSVLDLVGPADNKTKGPGA
jgi:tetratricopeptide (TPR) repeat protein